MRLICPNCGAQYEVPDEVIPKAGRDVQCSNCGDTWFQPHPDHRMEEGDEAATDYSDEEGTGWAAPPEAEPDPEAEPEEEPAAEPEEPARRDLDPDVASVLREEAAREEQARAAEARGGLETQPDLGLGQPEDEADRRSRQARARMARLRGADAPEETTEDEVGLIPSRRGLLPDIEETDTSMAGGADRQNANGAARDGSEAAPPPARTGGFRKGMRLAVGLALLGTAIYIFAPQLSATVPALADPLAAYVQQIDAWRLALHGSVGGLIAQVSALFAG